MEEHKAVLLHHYTKKTISHIFLTIAKVEQISINEKGTYVKNVKKLFLGKI